jgi:hypothetical protein
MMGLLAGGLTLMQREGFGPSTLPGAVATLMMALPLFWLAGFLLFASAKAARNAFNTAEVHAALPAVLTVVLVWDLLLVNLTVDGLPHGPVLAQLASVLGGPASVSAVAWWEMRRLRVLYGVRIRH